MYAIDSLASRQVMVEGPGVCSATSENMGTAHVKRTLQTQIVL